MCLLSYNQKPFVAEQDITCYKVLGFIEAGCYFITPHFDVHVSIPDTLMAMHYLDLPSHFDDVECCYKINGEGVHAWQQEKDAQMMAREAWWLRHPVVARCTIPAGTEYWLGRYDDIAARQLRIDTILTHKNPHEL